MKRYVHFASRLTGWNAIKSRAQQLDIEMTDAQYKECTTKIKALADIRPINVDDTDSILHAFYRNVKLGKATKIDGLLPNMTNQEKQLLAEKEAEIAAVPEKQALDEKADQQAQTDKIVEKAQSNGITA